MNTIISLYSGGGGIDEGIKQAGFKTTLAIDIDKDACNTFKLNHPGAEVINGNVKDYVHSLPKKPFALVGSPPCKEFSRGNPERTFDLCEVNNFWDAVGFTKPKYYLMENVPDIKTKLWKASHLIECADYGVPQTRQRRFFTNLPLPEPEYSSIGGQTNLFSSPNPKKMWVGIDQVLHLAPEEKYIINFKFLKQNRIMLTNPVSRPAPTITTGHSLCFVSKEIYSEKYTGVKIEKTGRPITLEEMAILQGFSKTYQFTGGSWAKQVQIGNAVPPPVTRAFFDQLNPNVINNE